jgi:hypothetical protein
MPLERIRSPQVARAITIALGCARAWPPLLHSYPGATRRAQGKELCTVVAIAQGMDHALQDPERV